MKLKIEKLSRDGTVKVEYRQSDRHEPVVANLTPADVNTILSMLMAANGAAVFRIDLQLEGR